MAKLTVVQAAKAGWPSRQTIYRKVRSGELSAEPDANGTAVIDTSELIRVFGEHGKTWPPARERTVTGCSVCSKRRSDSLPMMIISVLSSGPGGGRGCLHGLRRLYGEPPGGRLWSSWGALWPS